MNQCFKSMIFITTYEYNIQAKRISNELKLQDILLNDSRCQLPSKMAKPNLFISFKSTGLL